MANPISRRSFLAGGAGLVASASALARATVRHRFETERFVEEAVRAGRGPDAQAAIDELLALTVSQPGDVLRGLGEPSRVGVQTLHRSGELTVLNVVWAPLMVLLPHDHKMWASIGIYTGREDNIVWERSGGTIEARTAASLSEKEVFRLAVDAIHSVTNPIPRRTGAIHIYGGDFFAAGRSEWDPETLLERAMDANAVQPRFDEANERFETGRSR